MVEAGIEALDLAGRQVHLGLIQGARRRRCPKEDFTATRVDLLPGNTGRVVEKGGEAGQGEWRGNGRGARDSGERGHGHRVEGSWQGHRRGFRVYLERKRLDVPVERVGARANGVRRVDGAVVEASSNFRRVVQGRRSETNRYGGRKTPRSVTMAEISEAGVTSKAGL